MATTKCSPRGQAGLRRSNLPVSCEMPLFTILAPLRRMIAKRPGSIGRHPPFEGDEGQLWPMHTAQVFMQRWNIRYNQLSVTVPGQATREASHRWGQRATGPKPNVLAY